MDHGHWIFTDWINRNAFIEGYKMKMVGIYIYILEIEALLATN